MGYNDPDDGIDLTDKQRESIMIGGTVEIKVTGQETDISLSSQKMSLTVAQARMIVEALSQASFDGDVSTSVARKTQTQIRDQFDIEQQP